MFYLIGDGNYIIKCRPCGDLTSVRRTYEIPPYGSNLTIVVGVGSMNALAARHKLPPPCVSDEVRATVYPAHYPYARRRNGSKARWIVLLPPDADINTVAHEAVHAAVFVAQWHYLPLDFSDETVNHEEPLAYLTGWIAAKCQETIDEYWAVP